MKLPMRRVLLFAIPFWIAAVGAIGYAVYAVQSPDEPTHSRISVRPDLPHMLPDEALGYSLRPGPCEITILPRVPEAETLTFTVVNGSDGYRTTSERPEKHAGQPGVWVFGCSLSWGWPMDNDKNWPWLLQEHLPTHEVRNFSIHGYGTVHALLQLREFERKQVPPPCVAVFSFMPLHLPRNVGAPSRLRSFKKLTLGGHGLSHPRASLSPEGELLVELVPLFESNDTGAGSDAPDPAPVLMGNATQAIFTAIYGHCVRLGITPVLAVQYGPMERNPVVQHCRQLGFRLADVRVNYLDPQYNFQPADSHPNAKAHRLYLEKALPAIQDAIQACPHPEHR